MRCRICIVYRSKTENGYVLDNGTLYTRLSLDNMSYVISIMQIVRTDQEYIYLPF